MVSQDIHTTQLQKQVGATLRALRKEAGYSSYETFAYEIGMDSAQYGKYERGKNMEMSTLFRILWFHKMQPDAFFARVMKAIIHVNENSLTQINT